MHHRRQLLMRALGMALLFTLPVASHAGRIVWPCSAQVTSAYGPRSSPCSGCSTFHHGIDLGVPSGTILGSPGNGTVTSYSYSSCGGNTYKIGYGGGWETRFLHCSAQIRGVGTAVTRNVDVAKSGNTGTCTTGAHLHFEVRKDGVSQSIPGTPGNTVTRGNEIPKDYAGLNDGAAGVGSGNRVGIARAANGQGYWIASADGGVFSFGPGAAFYGSMGGTALNQPIVGICSRPQGDGYWLVAKDGGIFSFGAAPFRGSVPGVAPGVTNIVGMTCTADGNGYWIMGADGGVFSFNAPFRGSMGGQGFTDFKSIAPDWGNGRNGYWMVRSNGHIYSFGTCCYHGGGEAGSGVVGLASKSDGGGYWQVRNNGNVYTYGAMAYRGGASQTTFVGMAPGPSTWNGYWLLKNDGAVFSFGDATYYGGAN